jgi:hypothetical protein
VGEADFVDRLSHASIAYHYSSDRLGSLHATVQNKSNYFKFLLSLKLKINYESSIYTTAICNLYIYLLLLAAHVHYTIPLENK